MTHPQALFPFFFYFCSFFGRCKNKNSSRDVSWKEEQQKIVFFLCWRSTFSPFSFRWLQSFFLEWRLTSVLSDNAALQMTQFPRPTNCFHFLWGSFPRFSKGAIYSFCSDSFAIGLKSDLLVLQVSQTDRGGGAFEGSWGKLKRGSLTSRHLTLSVLGCNISKTSASEPVVGVASPARVWRITAENPSWQESSHCTPPTPPRDRQQSFSVLNCGLNGPKTHICSVLLHIFIVLFPHLSWFFCYSWIDLCLLFIL